MRVSLSAWGYRPADLIALAQDAEACGFAGLWLGDHIVAPAAADSVHPGASGSPGELGRVRRTAITATTQLVDPIVVLSAMAAVTERLRLGTAVLLPVLRHPLALARSLVSLQQVAQGRFVLGVGAGWLKEEFDAVHAPFERRGVALDESVQILRRACRGGYFAHDGDHWSFPSVQVTPARTPMPIIMGGNSAPALSRAARLGDGWFVSGSMSPGDCAGYRRAVLEQRSAHGRTGPFETIARTDRVSPTAVEAFRDEGFDELVLWADQVWIGQSAEERRERLAATAEVCGI